MHPSYPFSGRMKLSLAVLVLMNVAGGLTSPYPNIVMDLSHWNANVDLRLAKADGIEAVIHKATQNVSYVDPNYAERRAQAQREGLLWGAYHFASSGASGEKQARHFLKTVGNLDRVLLVVDLEQHGKGPSVSMKVAEDFVRTVKEATGRYPVVYGSSSFLSSMGTSRLLQACPLWVAHYTAQSKPRMPKGWGSWTLWQYTDGRQGGSPKTIRGVGACDIDRYNGTPEQLKNKWPNL